jgi:hypothetical protein
MRIICFLWIFFGFYRLESDPASPNTPFIDRMRLAFDLIVRAEHCPLTITRHKPRLPFRSGWVMPGNFPAGPGTKKQKTDEVRESGLKPRFAGVPRFMNPCRTISSCFPDTGANRIKFPRYVKILLLSSFLCRCCGWPGSQKKIPSQP